MHKSKPLLDCAKGKGQCTAIVSSDTCPNRSSTVGSSPTNDDDKMSTLPPSPPQPKPLPVRSKPPMDQLPPLQPPRLNNNAAVTGATTPRLRIENKQRRKKKQAEQ